MSGIAGIFNIDGATIDRDQIGRMAGALKSRGPDGIRIYVDGSAGFVHAHFWTTPEEVGEEQPVSSGHVWVTADVRLDNRDDLLPRLKGYLTSKMPSDAELILAAYRTWGEDCARFLLGDFAFAIWDNDAQKLFCARDPVGVKVFHYAQRQELLTFGSSIGAIIAALGNLPEINLPFIGDYLAGGYERWVHETAYRGIFRLPPAHQLTADSRGVVLRRYWTLGAGRGPHFKTDEEYIAYFRDLFREAVRVRMRAVGPVGLTVSGGLDSSSIACVMNRIVSESEIHPECRLYSNTYDRTPAADEKGYLEILSSSVTRFPLVRIPSDDLWGLREFAADNDFPLDDPEISVLRSLTLAPFREAFRDGCRVVMAGVGGDEVMNANAYSNYFMIKDLGLRRFFSEMKYFPRYNRRFYQFFALHERLIANADFPPVIPKRLLVRMYRMVSRYRLHGLLSPHCNNLSPPADFLLPPPQLESRCAQMIYNAVTEGYHSVSMAHNDIWAAYGRIELRLPFYDRRLIEFMLSLPPRLNFRNGFSRYIIRQSVNGLVPDEIRLRTTKTHTGGLQERGLTENEQARVLALFDNSRAVQMGLVNRMNLLKAWDLYTQRRKYPLRPIVRFLCTEAWLRHYDERMTRK